MGAILASMFLRSSSIQGSKFNVPLPDVLHQIITKEEIGERDVLVVGDVHGCFDELKELVEDTPINKENTLFLFCGDIINKGPFSIKTLRYVRNLPHVYAVRGNHEEHIIEHIQQVQSDDEAAGKLAPKYKWILDLADDDIAYLRNLPYTLSIPHLNSIVVHAGLYPWTQLENQRIDDMILIRDIVNPNGPKSEASKHSDGGGVPWATCWSGPEHVYFGHDARRGLQKYPLCTGLDSGCVYGKSLTARYITGSQQFLTVKAKMMYKAPKNDIDL